MAIIIPSKNIYEINNQKVVDNEVDNIEVGAKRIEETKDYSVNVYNNDFDVVTYQHGAETSDIHEEYRLHTQAPTSYCAVSGVFKPFYVDIDVVVNKQIGNKIITQIKTGEDKTDETANIKYSTACIKKSAPISATYNTSESGRHDPSFANIQYTYPDDGEEGVFNLPKTITVQHNYSDISLSEITVNLNDETNLKDIGRTIKITETNDYFSFRCHLLCGEEIYELKGDAVGPPTNRSTASGTATIYIPQKISLTVYGNTIGIDLQDETVKIGDGQHVYSFNGNELMQTSNTPSIKSRYNEIIRDWKNGKETIKLKCAISDYFGNEDTIITTATKQVQSKYNLKRFSSVGCSLNVDFNYESQSVTITNNSDKEILANIAISTDESEGSTYPNTEFNHNYYNVAISPHGKVEKSFSIIGGIKSRGVVYFADITVENTEEYYIDYGESGQAANAQTTFTIPFNLNAYVNGQFAPVAKNPYDIYSQHAAYCYYETENNLIHWENVVLKEFTCDVYWGEILPTQSDYYTDIITYSYKYNNFQVYPDQKRISLTKKGDYNEDLNMTICVGDKIVPYLMNSMGEDVPVSLYFDKKTPKQFLVVSEGIIADGQIMQDITAQEITFELPSEEEETTTTTTTTTPQSANIQLIDRRGDWELYAPKSIKR